MDGRAPTTGPYSLWLGLEGTMNPCGGDRNTSVVLSNRRACLTGSSRLQIFVMRRTLLPPSGSTPSRRRFYVKRATRRISHLSMTGRVQWASNWIGACLTPLAPCRPTPSGPLICSCKAPTTATMPTCPYAQFVLLLMGPQIRTGSRSEGFPMLPLAISLGANLTDDPDDWLVAVVTDDSLCWTATDQVRTRKYIHSLTSAPRGADAG